MTEMIEGINPTTISKIVVHPFIRFGRHPMYYRLRRKKLGGFLAAILVDEDEMWCWVQTPAVALLGADRKELTTIPAKSNADATKKCEELQNQLESFLRRATAVGSCYMEPLT